MTTRIEKIQQFLKDDVYNEQNIDGLLVYQGSNTRYLADFRGGSGEGVLLIGKEKATLFTDARYTEEYAAHLPVGVDFFETRQYYAEAAKAMALWGMKKVGFEDDLPFKYFDFIDTQLPNPIDLMPMPGLVEAFREIKDETEISLLREATRRSVVAFNQLLEELAIGMSEKEVVNLLDGLARQQGLEKMSFDTIVASGLNGAKPHATATDKLLQAGELVTIDFGYYYQGYTSDITRTIALGDIDPKLTAIYEVALKAERQTIQAVKPDVAWREVDAVARQTIETAGYGEYFEHATGHAVGLDIHEAPIAAARSQDESTVGQLMTIEPGIYVPGLGGVRIEDDVLVTEDGHENLTSDISTDLIKIIKSK